MTSHDLSRWRDDELFGACRRIVAIVDPPPAHVTVAARAAFLARHPESITPNPDPEAAPPMADWIG